MIAERTFNWNRLNYLANSPDIRPFIGGDGLSVLDFENFVRNPKNICIEGEHGFFLLEEKTNYIYEVHTIIKKSGCGIWARKFAAAALSQFDVKSKLFTLVPVSQRHIALFARQFGFKPSTGKNDALNAKYTTYEWSR